jgi:hypothetical protein
VAHACSNHWLHKLLFDEHRVIPACHIDDYMSLRVGRAWILQSRFVIIHPYEEIKWLRTVLAQFSASDPTTNWYKPYPFQGGQTLR